MSFRSGDQCVEIHDEAEELGSYRECARPDGFSMHLQEQKAAARRVED